MGDLNGNLAVVDYRGEEVWSKIVSGGLAHVVNALLNDGIECYSR